MSRSCLAALLLLLLLHLLCPVASRPQAEASSSPAIGEQHQQEEEAEPVTRGPQDPLRWIWLDGSSLSMEWPSRFSLSINGAVTAYSLSLTHPNQRSPFLTTTMFHAATLRHQFEGLRSNVTYAGRLMALVGPHHWPYTLLNFTVTSPSLHTGLGLGQRANPARPRSTTADLDAISVSVTLRWSPTPFLKGNPEGETVQPTGYRLRVWDQKKLVTQITNEASSHTQDCEAAVGGLALDAVYKATLDAVLPDGEPGTSLTFTLDAGALHVAGGGLTTDGVSECYSGLQVRCPGSERCVSPYWICDGAPDCPDGADEEGCDTTPCDGFQCWDDVCIPWAWRCDGHLDCKGGDDEYACPSCNEGDLRCPWGGECLQHNATCDGVAHCKDGWDESAALCGSVTCKPGELQCLGGNRCVPHQWLCDGVSDCPAAEDEDATFCSAFNSFRNSNGVFNTTDESLSSCEGREAPKRVNCTEEEFRCDSTTCVLREYVCDGVRDCENGRDELPKSCSFAPTVAAKSPKFRFDSEEDFSDADQHVFSNEDESECSEQESDLCGTLDIHSTGIDSGGEEQSTTTDTIQTHSQKTTTEKAEQVHDYNNRIENDLPDVRVSTPSTTTATFDEGPFVSIIEANMTDVGGNEIDVSLIEYSDSVSSDEDDEATNKTHIRGSVNVEVLMEEEDGEEMNPTFTQPETGLNLSSSEEYDYEEDLLLEIDRLSPFGSKNMTDPSQRSRQGTNGTSIQKLDVLTEEVSGEDVSSEEIDDSKENENVTLVFLPKLEHNTVTVEPEETTAENGSFAPEEDDSVVLVVSEDPITYATSEKATPHDEATQNINTSTTASTNTQGPPTSTIPGAEVTSHVLPTSHVRVENASLPLTVTNESVVTEGEDLSPEEPSSLGDTTSADPSITRESDTTTPSLIRTTTVTSTTSTSTSSPSSKSEVMTSTATQVATVRTESTVSPDEAPATSTTPPLPSSTLAPTSQPPTGETGQKNLTILIAIRAGLNESEIPQYTIHGIDGNTYPYEIVSIVKEETEDSKDREAFLNALEEEEEMTNEIRGDGSHQFLQGIKISSATRFSSPGTSFLVLILLPLLFTTVGFDVK